MSSLEEDQHAVVLFVQERLSIKCLLVLCVVGWFAADDLLVVIHRDNVLATAQVLERFHLTPSGATCFGNLQHKLNWVLLLVDLLAPQQLLKARFVALEQVDLVPTCRDSILGFMHVQAPVDLVLFALFHRSLVAFARSFSLFFSETKVVRMSSLKDAEEQVASKGEQEPLEEALGGILAKVLAAGDCSDSKRAAELEEQASEQLRQFMDSGASFQRNTKQCSLTCWRALCK